VAFAALGRHGSGSNPKPKEIIMVAQRPDLFW